MPDYSPVTVEGMWRCPVCGRPFGRRNQSHTCAPAMTLEAYFASGPAFERAIFEAVYDHLRGFEPLEVEPVSVGIFFKRRHMFAELRPRRDRVVLTLMLSRRITHPRIRRTLRAASERTVHYVDLHTADDVDDQVCDWLSEAYLASPL
jgi:hypothetical protein